LVGEGVACDQDLRDAFGALGGDMSSPVVIGEDMYTIWWAKSKSTKPKSPFTFIWNKQRMDLLHRSAPLGAVMQKIGSKLIRVFSIFCGLRNEEGRLVGYLMGLYKYKCNSTPIWSDVFNIDSNELVVFNDIKSLVPFTCDRRVKPTQAAIDAHNLYFESKRWHECGVFDESGIMRDNRCIHFNAARERQPSDEEPGEDLYAHSMLSLASTN
jgi:hypothetical protein